MTSPASPSPNLPSINPPPSSPPSPTSAHSAHSAQDDPSIPAPPPDFTPFFTLLSTTNSSTTHHPSVHYIFASDPPDTSPLTAAALEVLSSPASHTSPNSTSPTSPSSPTTPHLSDAKTGAEGKMRGRRERYILLDLSLTGKTVLSAQSLSPDFAVTRTEIRDAPTWEGGGAQGDGEKRGGGLVLRIEGVEARSSLADGEETGEGKGKGKGVEQKSLEGLIEEYERGMRELRGVVEANRMGDQSVEEGEGGG